MIYNNLTYLILLDIHSVSLFFFLNFAMINNSTMNTLKIFVHISVYLLGIES